VNRPEGACLTLAYGVFVAIVLVRERRHPGDAHGFAVDDARGEGRVAGRAALAFGGLAVVTLGGWLAVTGAERIVTRFDLAASGVGLTLVAFATSAELLALLWAARRHRVSELALSALVGSVVGNATATLGVAALVRPLDTRGVTSAAWLAAGLSVLLLVPGGGSRRRGRILGVLLVASYVVFVALALR
jgi:cation:H+ antiporter